MTLAEWALLASCLAGAAVTFFLAVYMTVAPWWRSQEGQNVVLLSAVIVLAAALAIVGRLGFLDVARVGAIVVWTTVAIAYVWRTGLVLRAQGILRRRKPPQH